MKKRLFFMATFIMSLVFVQNINATHLMGGEITWQCIKDPASPNLGQYIFTMKLYRDCDGTTLSTLAQNIEVWEDGINIQNISCAFISNTDISPNCDVANSGNLQLDCYGTNPAGAVEEYIYQSLPVQLNLGATPGTPSATGWHFTWNSCCRNGAITNLLLSSPTNPSEGFTLRAAMYPYTDPATGNVVPADPCFDSSPVFNESPKTIICAGYPFAYSHNASDPEIDSIRYYWAQPLDDFFGSFDPDPLNNNPGAIPFVAPYAFNAPLPGTPTLNPISGEISYSTTVAQSGFYATVTEVRAYKCGQEIAKIFRDIQAVLIACPSMSGVPNDPPLVPTPTGAQTWTISPGSSVLDAYETTVTAGEFVTFNIIGLDSNLYNGVTPQDLTMEISGGQIFDPITGTCANPPCATFVSLAGLPPPIISPTFVEGIFEWQTTCDHVSSDVACGRTTNLYQFSVKVFDDFCPAPAIRNVTLMVYVEADNQMQISEIQPSCFGNDGVITIEPSLSITQVAWDALLFDLSGNLVDSVANILGNTGSLTNLSPGEYIVRASGAGGCLVQDSITLLLAPNPLIMETNVSHVNCYGGSDGEIGVFLDNGLLPYSFYINGVQNTNPPPYDSLFTGLSEGLYIITGIDSDSCGLRDTIYIDVPQFPLQILSNNSIVVCDTSLGGSAYAYAAGGSPYSDSTYIFDWYDSNWGIISSGDSVSNLAVGDYFLEVTDSNGCQANIPITVATPQLALSLSPQLFGVVCTGDSTGSAVVFAGGGSTPYSYEWSDLSGAIIQTTNNIITRDTLSRLVAGSYHLLITDAAGCTEQMSFIIDEPSVRLEISSVLVVDSIKCYGDGDGRGIVHMLPGSGLAPYSYLWDNGETTQEAVALSGGWHTVWVSDTRGCVVEDSVYIPENSEIISTLSIDSIISCFGDNDGVISVSTQGGVLLPNPPYYDYFWSTGAPTNATFINSLSHGSYYVITRDALGCVVVDSIYLPEPDPVYVNAEEILRASCYGVGDASAYAVGVGGTLPYQFIWVNNTILDASLNDSSIVNTLFYGLETVVLTDARGCVATDTVMINHPDPLVVSISDSVLAYCTGINTASATAVVFGGTAPYAYEWNDNIVFPQTTITASNLDPGTYMVSVEDSRGCLDSVSVDLNYVPDTMSASISIVSNVSCYGSNDGALTAQVNPAGIPPYTYQWVGPTGIDTSGTISNLPAGIYSVTVTDVNGCVVNTSQQLTAPAPLIYEVVSATNTSCLGACDGTLLLNVQGGITPYIAHLLNNQSGSSSLYNVIASSLVDGICTGDYTVTIDDDNGCAAALLFGGSNQASLNTSITTAVTTSSVDVLCYGDATGELSILNSLNPPYSYVWLDLNGDTIGTTITIDNLLAGDYILHAGYNGINGCTAIDTLTVLENSLIQSNAIVTDVSCNGGSDGVIDITAVGGVPPYWVSWSNGSTTSIISNLSIGSYSVTITDDNSCVVTESYYIDQPSLLVATVTASQTYVLNALAAGGTPPYSYQWYSSGALIFGATSDNYTVGANGTYSVEVTDANNCTTGSNSIPFNETSLTDFDGSIDLNVYPNPFREETTVDFGQIVSKATITIVDVYGKFIEIHELRNTDKYIIQGNNKASGVYFMEIKINKVSIKSKLIIK